MAGHRKWSEIKHKSSPDADERILGLELVGSGKPCQENTVRDATAEADATSLNRTMRLIEDTRQHILGQMSPDQRVQVDARVEELLADLSKATADMEHRDFVVGESFWTDSGEWRCTDIGACVIVAIRLDQADPRNYSGPPYGIVETVFDEYDFGGCFRTPADLIADREAPV